MAIEGGIVDIFSGYDKEELDGFAINAHRSIPGGITLVYEFGTEFFQTETIEDVTVIDDERHKIAVLLYGKRLDNFVDEREIFIWPYEASSRKIVYFSLRRKQDIRKIINLFLMTIWEQKELLRKMKIEIRVV